MASGAFFRRPAVLLALALGSVGLVVTLLGRLATGPALEPKRTLLSGETGTKAYPAFSPDGKRVAYSARDAGKADAFHIFVRTVAPDTARQLTSGPANDVSPAWSPDGNRIAFLRVDDGRAQYLVVPVAGGAETRVAEFPFSGDETQPPPSVAWTAGGKSLVVVAGAEKQSPAIAVAAIDGGQVTRISVPPENSPGDSMPAVSPDGATVAFVRGAPSAGGDIYLSDLTGRNPRRLTFDNRGIRGLSWTPDGREILYASDRARGWQVWRVAGSGGSPRDIILAGTRASYPAVAPSGRLLAFTDSQTHTAVWRATLGSPNAEPAGERPLLRSPGGEASPMYSPDGKWIADISDQSGADEIWVSDAEGGNRRQITSFKGPPMWRVRWSPDGKTLLFDARGDHGPDLYSVAAVPGAKPRRLVPEGWNASFSQDGKRIYFDTRGQVWKAAADGANPEVLTKTMGAAQPVESPDGKYVYFRARRSFYRVPVAGGEEEEAIVPERDLAWITTLQLTPKGAYYAERSARFWVVSYYDFAAKKSSVVVRLKDLDFGQGHIFSISPDGKYILYPKVDHSQTDLMLVENFR